LHTLYRFCTEFVPHRFTTSEAVLKAATVPSVVQRVVQPILGRLIPSGQYPSRPTRALPVSPICACPRFPKLAALWNGFFQPSKVAHDRRPARGCLVSVRRHAHKAAAQQATTRKKKKGIVIPVGAPLQTVLDARRPEKAEALSYATRSATLGPVTDLERLGQRHLTARNSATMICIFMICAVPR
jgi:hypothetical protein